MLVLYEIINMPKQNFLTPPQTRKTRLPSWFKVKATTQGKYLKIRRLARDLNLHTVCEEAQCPNIWECWNAGTATFMILGDICTRSCGFCAVKLGQPGPIDLEEPRHVAEAVAKLALSHVVITSVNRDELSDGGAAIFAETICKIREYNPNCTIEVLISDFQGKKASLDLALAARPDMLSHNIETVPSLYRRVRPQARYERSLKILEWSKKAGFRTKTGLMLGLGESQAELQSVMVDLVEIGCDILTLGQYLQPTAKHLPVEHFVTPESFQNLKALGEDMGLTHVEAGPLVRSSYHAAEQISVMPLVQIASLK